MDAVIEMGPSVTDTLVTTLTKLSTSQEAMDITLYEIKKFWRAKYFLYKSFQLFSEKSKTTVSEGLILQSRGQNSFSSTR